MPLAETGHTLLMDLQSLQNSHVAGDKLLQDRQEQVYDTCHGIVFSAALPICLLAGVLSQIPRHEKPGSPSALGHEGLCRVSMSL